MALIDIMLSELEQQAETTKRVLERVPERLSWRPHQGARTLGELAVVVATRPGDLAAVVTDPPLPQAERMEDAPSALELPRALEQSIALAKQVMSALDDEALLSPVPLMVAERELLRLPRGMLVDMVLKHWQEQRIQLSSYLRAMPADWSPLTSVSNDEAR
jgi:hypothetical protein